MFGVLLQSEFEEHIFYIFTLKKRITLSFEPAKIKALNVYLFYVSILERIKLEKSKIDLKFNHNNLTLQPFSNTLSQSPAVTDFPLLIYIIYTCRN